MFSSNLSCSTTVKWLLPRISWISAKRLLIIRQRDRWTERRTDRRSRKYFFYLAHNASCTTILRQFRLPLHLDLFPPSGIFTSDVLHILLALGHRFEVRPSENEAGVKPVRICTSLWQETRLILTGFYFMLQMLRNGLSGDSLNRYLFVNIPHRLKCVISCVVEWWLDFFQHVSRSMPLKRCR
jgi:hypothetical protein